jgi:hypothetical protein
MVIKSPGTVRCQKLYAFIDTNGYLPKEFFMTSNKLPIVPERINGSKISNCTITGINIHFKMFLIENVSIITGKSIRPIIGRNIIDCILKLIARIKNISEGVVFFRKQK